MTIPDNEKVSDPCKEMASLVEKFLTSKKWSFTESYRSVKDGRLIFDSQWCRLKVVWSGWDMYTGNIISAYYGRSHALNENTKMDWNGMECHCWIDITGYGLVLDYLDGLAPQEIVDRKRFPKAVEEFRQSQLWENLITKRRQPELLVRMHAFIWRYYGTRLFELFDLRRPDLWEKYRQFLKEYYDIKGRSPNVSPSLDKVC